MEVGVPELLIILVIIVLLWGPGRLSKIGGELGSGIKAFRSGLSGDEDKKGTVKKEPEQLAEHVDEPAPEVAVTGVVEENPLEEQDIPR